MLSPCKREDCICCEQNRRTLSFPKRPAYKGIQWLDYKTKSHWYSTYFQFTEQIGVPVKNPLTSYQEVTGLNLDRIYFLQTNAWKSALNYTTNASFHINSNSLHSLLTILSFNTVESEILTESLNKPLPCFDKSVSEFRTCSEPLSLNWLIFIFSSIIRWKGQSNFSE
jgi:hypothetical protein